MQNGVKIIFHIDMNAFFCSVACLKYPHLRGTVFAIGRENTYKGVLSTASYEARALGIHSAMSLRDAFKIKPDLTVVHIDYRIYQEYHNKFINVIKEYTNIIEVASIDEVYADMTEISKLKHSVVLAKEIQERLLREHGLPCSIGIAPTLFLAKMASDIKKPLGVTVIRKREVEKILYPLSVKEIFGIGKKTYPRLIENGITTIRDFMNPDNMDKVISLVGKHSYDYVVSHVLGNSSNVVDPNRWANSKSISECVTFDVHLSSLEQIVFEARSLLRNVINNMKCHNYLTKTVGITLRDSSFNTITRSRSLDDYTDDSAIITDVIMDLFEENYNEDLTYRLIGVDVANLISVEDLPREYNLFTICDIDEKENTIKNLINEFQEKYGKNVLYRNKKK